MRDAQIENRLRQALHAEADSLPFSLTIEELDRRLAVRNRGRMNRLSLLSAAAAIIVVVGIGAALVLDRGRTPPVGSTGSPSTSIQPSPTPRPTSGVAANPLDTFEAIEAMIGNTGIVVHRDERLAQPGSVGSLVTDEIGPIESSGGFLDVAYDCLGTGPFRLEWKSAADGTEAGAIEIGSCDGPTAIFTSADIPTEALLAVIAPAETAWRVVVYEPVDPDASFSPPTLEHQTKLDERRLEGEGATETFALTVAADIDNVTVLATCAGAGSIDVFDGLAHHEAACTARGTASTAWGVIPTASGGVTVRVENHGDVRAIVQLYSWRIGDDPALAFVPPTATLSTAGQTVRAVLGCGLSFRLASGESAADQCPGVYPLIPADRALLAPDGTELSLSVPGWTITGLTGTVGETQALIDAAGEGGQLPSLVNLDGGTDTVTFGSPSVGDWTLNLVVNASRNGDEFSVPYVVRVVVRP